MEGVKEALNEIQSEVDNDEVSEIAIVVRLNNGRVKTFLRGDTMALIGMLSTCTHRMNCGVWDEIENRVEDGNE